METCNHNMIGRFRFHDFLACGYLCGRGGVQLRLIASYHFKVLTYLYLQCIYYHTKAYRENLTESDSGLYNVARDS